MNRHRSITPRSVTNGIAKASSSSSESSSPSASPDEQPVIGDLARVSTTTEVPFYLLAKRPSIVRMRDLSPESRAKVIDEYYQSYDVMTGLRIAATLGGLITLFTLFLLYKSKCKSYKEADLSPMSDTNSSAPGSFQVVAIGVSESVASNQQLGMTYQDSYFLPNPEEPRRKRHHRNSYGNEDTSGSKAYAAANTTLTPSTSSNSASSTNVTSAEVNVVSECQRNPSYSKGSPQYQTSLESENPEPSTSSYQGSSTSDWAKEIVISKRHLWVQYRPSVNSDGVKSEEV